MAVSGTNPNHFNIDKGPNSQKSNEKKNGNKNNNLLLKTALLGAGAIAVAGGVLSWAFGNEKAKAEAEAVSASNTQTESTQTSHDTTSEAKVSNINNSSTKTTETAITSEYSKWSSGDYQKSIDSLEASTIDNLTARQILAPESVTQEKIVEMASFYMDEDINNESLYFFLTDKDNNKEDNLLNLATYKEYMSALNDPTDSPEKGQAILDSIFYARMDAYNAYDAKKSMVILRSAFLVKSIGADEITTSNVCSNAIEQIIKADNDYKKSGSTTVFNYDESDKPKFISFAGTTPEMTNSAGNKYESGKIIEYMANGKTMYILTTKSAEKQFDYKDDEIIIPMAVTYGSTLNLPKKLQRA